MFEPNSSSGALLIDRGQAETSEGDKSVRSSANWVMLRGASERCVAVMAVYIILGTRA